LRPRVLVASGAMLAGLVLGVISGLGAEAQSRDERAVRAAYIFNLIKYVEWPVQDKELLIGFNGDAATGEVMERLLGGKTSEGQTIRVVLFPSDEELGKCRLLYFAGDETPEVRKTLDKVKGRGVLTVGEKEGFALDGGMIGLVNSGDHIRIEVNLEAAQSAGIKISSRVLNLALIVRPVQKGGR
jgi:hypothetical protein